MSSLKNVSFLPCPPHFSQTPTQHPSERPTGYLPQSRFQTQGPGWAPFWEVMIGLPPSEPASHPAAPPCLPPPPATTAPGAAHGRSVSLLASHPDHFLMILGRFTQALIEHLQCASCGREAKRIRETTHGVEKPSEGSRSMPDTWVGRRTVQTEGAPPCTLGSGTTTVHSGSWLGTWGHSLMWLSPNWGPVDFWEPQGSPE